MSTMPTWCQTGQFTQKDHRDDLGQNSSARAHGGLPLGQVVPRMPHAQHHIPVITLASSATLPTVRSIKKPPAGHRGFFQSNSRPSVAGQRVDRSLVAATSRFANRSATGGLAARRSVATPLVIEQPRQQTAVPLRSAARRGTRIAAIRGRATSGLTGGRSAASGLISPSQRFS